VTHVEAGSNTSTVTLRVVGGDEKGRTRERLRWQGPAAYTKDRPVFRAEIKIWSQAPDGCFIPRQTGQLTVGRNIRPRLKNRSSWKGATIQRVFEHGSRGIAIVRSHYQATTSEDTMSSVMTL
jgi:hypothetical protein